MIIDKLLQFSDAQPITATAVSTDVVDQGPNVTDIGFGNDLALSVTVAQAFAGAASLQVVLQDSADNATFRDLASSNVVAQPALQQGATVAVMYLPPDIRRYVRLNYVVSGGSFSAGKVSAAFTLGIARNKIYPAGTRT